MSDLSADTPPQRTLLSQKSEYAGGFRQLLGLLRHELRIFDPDLSDLEMNSPDTISRMSGFLRDSRTHRIFIAVHDVEYITKYCPRLMTLLGRFADRLFIQQTRGDAARVQDCFVLADHDHLVRRPVTSQPRGVLILNDPKDCEPMHERFQEIWESSEPAVSANRAGL